MSYPFRSPNTGDGDPPDWSPPDYAQPVAASDDNENWKPPSYATAVEQKKPAKQSIFSRAIEALKPAKEIHPKSSERTPGPDTTENPSSEPGTFTGGYLKGLKEWAIGKHPLEEIKKSFSAENPLLESSAHPQTAGDVLGLLLPGEIGGAASKTFESSIREEPPISQRSREIPYRMGGSTQEAPKDIELPSRESVVKQPTEKPKFVNPFERKPTDEMENVQRNAPYGEGSIMPSSALPTERRIAAENAELPQGVAKDRRAPKLMPSDALIQEGRQREILSKLGGTGEITEELPSSSENIAAVKEQEGEWKPPSYAEVIKEGEPKASEIDSRISGLEPQGEWKPPEYAKPAEGEVKTTNPDDITEMHGGLGGIGGGKKNYPPSTGPAGTALDKLFNSMGGTLEKRVQQDVINKTERARRFGEFASVKQEGVEGAKRSLSALKGEFEKVDPEKLQMKPEEADTLFTTVKRAKITEGEKARGYTALFKLLNGEGLPQRNELRILDDVFGNGFADRITEMHGGIGAVGLKLSKLANTMKSMQNSISLAAPLRHGIGLVARKEFYPAFGDMFKFFGNKEYYDTAMKAIEERPNYMLGRESGLFTAKPGSLQGSEEEFLNSYAGSIPGVRNVVGASQRAYTGFLNKLRSDTFDSMIKQAKGLGYGSTETIQLKNADGKLLKDKSGNIRTSEVPSKETKAISRFINNATGRGDLGSLNKMTNELNLLLWSPRMIASRVQMFTNPKIYTSLPKGMRLEGLKSLLGIAALGTAIDTLATYGGAKVSTNILSTDFGKSRFGSKLIDPWGGFQQYVVGAARFLAGKTDTKTYPPPSRLDIAGQFMKNKESPAASLAHTILTSKFTGKSSEDPTTAGNMTTQYGEKTNIQSQIGKQFIPIFIQDLHDLMQTEPDWADNIGLNTAMGAASLAGMEQSYPEKKQGLKFGKLRR